ncbi:hypothetical protein [uncultured Chryseobacterium sp.]|uniref:hypothetical protein n=1 Tax=uncultured Chryseobacterium sp. TaxID=259322 RepID=UPI0026004FB4|nr:hypothetical protein [uncultured Chryseobacterium sp.]
MKSLLKIFGAFVLAYATSACHPPPRPPRPPEPPKRPRGMMEKNVDGIKADLMFERKPMIRRS